MCLAGADETFGPGALFRGGDFGFGTAAGAVCIRPGSRRKEAATLKIIWKAP